VLLFSACGDSPHGQELDGGLDGRPDGLAAAFEGNVSLSRSDRAGASRYSASAAFTLPAPRRPCTETVGDCCYYAPGPVDSPTEFLDAGRIVVENATSAMLYANLAFTPAAEGAPGTYYVTNLPPIHWQGGDVIRARAAGATVPAFIIETPAIDPIAIVSPATWQTGVAIPLGADYEVRWTPGISADVATVELSMALEATDLGAAAHGSVICSALDRAGHLTIPQSILAHFSSHDLCYACAVTRASTAFATGPATGVSLRVEAALIGDVTIE
jgi:hypothetical protein